MKINLLSLAALVLMCCMITMAMNLLRRALLKAAFFLKALLMQVPFIRRAHLLALRTEQEAAQIRMKSRRPPEERKPTLSMEEAVPAGKLPGADQTPEELPDLTKSGLYRKQKQKQKQERSRNGKSPEQGS